MTGATKLLNLGIVGAGGIAGAHLKYLKVVGPEAGARVVAISDVNQELAKEKATTYNIPNVFDDYRDLIAHSDVDAVVICTPNFLHAPVATEALKAEKHVFCEKPMAMTVEEAQEMVDLAESHERILMIGQHHRYGPEVRKVKQLAEEGFFGRLYFVRTGWLRRNGIPGWGSWFTQKDLAGGGALIDIGVHMLDVAWYLMGSPAPTRVMGTTFAEFGPDKRGLGGWGTMNEKGIFDVEDLASAMVRFEDGRALTVDVSWAAHHPNRSWLYLMGERGGATLLDGPLTLYTEKDGKPVEWQPEVDTIEAREQLWRHFIDCCHTGKKPISSGEEGLQVMRMLRGIYESAETGQEADLSEA